MSLTNSNDLHTPWWKGDWRYYFYYIMHTTGGAGLTLLLLTMWLPIKRVRRNPILISMCLSWWLGAFPNLTLLFYTNDLFGAQPSQAVCLASAALVMAQTPLTAVCAVSLVFNVWSVLHFNSARSAPSPARTFFLVTLPYIVFVICAGSVVVVGLLRPETVSRATFYCVVRNNVLTIFLGIFGGVCCLLAIVLEIWIAVILRRNRRKISDEGMDVQLVVRVVLFGGYIFAGLALSAVSVINWTSVVPDLCFSTFGLAVFLIFGSQKDVLRVWQRWFCCCLIPTEQDSRRTTTHQRQSSFDGSDPDGKLKRHVPKMMGDLATLQTNANTTIRSPYNSNTDFQFQFESDIGLESRKGRGKATKSKDAWWGRSTGGGEVGEGSQSWYPDLGYDYAHEDTSRISVIDAENGHGQTATRRSSLTVPSEFASPKSPENAFFQQPAATLSHSNGFAFPYKHRTVSDSVALEPPHSARSFADTPTRDSHDTHEDAGLPGYYFRDHSHTYIHSTDYRSSLDSSLPPSRARGRYDLEVSPMATDFPPPTPAYHRQDVYRGNNGSNISLASSQYTNPSLIGRHF